ncbi:hypothetical protein ACA040_000550 [Xenophilus aerolatus]
MNDLLEIDGWKTARAGWRWPAGETGTLGVLLLLFEEGRSIHYARGVIELQSPQLPRVKAGGECFQIDSSDRWRHQRSHRHEAQ